MTNKPTTTAKNNVVLALSVAGAVGLNLLAAIGMKILSQVSNISPVLLVAGIGIVIILNGLRLLIWMFANKRFPLSTMYPLTSLFYPLMLVVSYFFGERITLFHIAGTVLITLGVFWLGWKIQGEAAF